MRLVGTAVRYTTTTHILTSAARTAHTNTGAIPSDSHGR